MTWDQRHWLKDSKTFPKCPRTCKSLKIEQVMPCRSWEIFVKWQKSTILENPILTKGPHFSHFVHPCHATHVAHGWFQDQMLTFLFYLIFDDLIHFNSLKIQIKFKNQWNSVMWTWTISMYHGPTQKLRLGLSFTLGLGLG